MDSEQRQSYQCEEKMLTTPEQDEVLKKMDAKLKEMFPDFHGSVRFNITPNMKKMNVNVVENIIK